MLNNSATGDEGGTGWDERTKRIAVLVPTTESIKSYTGK